MAFSPETDSYDLLAGWLVDGSGAPARERVRVRIEKGLISEIGTVEEWDPPGSGIADFRTCTLLPGLVDCHVHLFMSGTTERKIREDQLDSSFEDIEPVIARHIKQLRQYGVVAVRDGGDKNGHALRFRQQCLENLGAPFQIKVPGRAWHAPNRYGRLIGRIPVNGMLSEDISKETAPIDHVKIVNSGLNSLLSFGRQTAPQFSLETMQCAVQAAECRGWGVMVHANGEVPVQIAVDAGCRSVEHGFFMGEENLKRMADHHTYWVPSAFTMKAYADYYKKNDTCTDVPRRNLDHQLEQMAAARTFGVPMAVGTDAGSLGVHHGAGIIEEITLFIEAGFPIHEAIQCAASNGAKLLGLDGTGVIKPGAQATFIAVEGGTAGLPESLRDIRVMVVHGRSLKSSVKSH